VTVEGRFLGRPVGGSGAFRREGCADVTVVLRADAPAGRSVRLTGVWREGAVRPWFAASDVALLPDVRSDDDLHWRAVRWRDGLVQRFERLYGARAPLVAALTLARTEGFDRELRDAFSRVGTSHLLAISGFHVAVIAGVVLTLLRALRLRARPAELGAAGATWAYVALIGFPDPAVRAAIMLTLAALARARGRPVARWGPLATAWLLLVVSAPSRVTSVGFQLSFAGVTGLIAWSAPLTARIAKAGGRRCPRALASALGAGVAATLATLPVVAWHFERVSLVGIPMTVVQTPLVSLALIGSLASLALDFVSREAAMFLAGGVSVLLEVLARLTEAAARWPWASVWTTRTSVVAGTLGVAVATHLARRPRVGGTARRTLVALYAASAVLAWPTLLAWQGRGTVEVVVIDVGQGDAVAVRSPRGRWLLFDTGTEAGSGDPGEHPVVRALRARGARRLEALILTHAHLDHIGGAEAVLASFDVGAVYDPAQPAPSAAFLEVLETAERRGVPWRAARAGARLVLDGLEVAFLWPEETAPPEVDPNETSVVARLSFGAWDALFTGDQYKEVERHLADRVGDLEVLKVGHHGSDTSTDSLLLARGSPEVAVISVGRGNRYRHPDPEVVERLEQSGARVLRTDVDGQVTLLARADGSTVVSTERARR